MVVRRGTRTASVQGELAEVVRVGPWGIVKKVRNALCSDGKRRTAFNVKMPDTYFSMPAQVKVGNVTVTGYVTPGEEGDMEFKAYVDCKNGGLLP